MRRELIRTLSLAGALLSCLIAVSSVAAARTVISTYSLTEGEVPSLPERSSAPMSVSKSSSVERLKIENNDTQVQVAPTDARTCVSLNVSDVRPRHYLQPSTGLTAVRAERIEYHDEGAELSIHDYWVDTTRGGATLAKVTRIPLTHLTSKLDVDVFAFRDGSALEVVAATRHGVVIDAQVDAARCAHARSRLTASPKDGGILRYIVAVARPTADFEVDDARRHSVSSEERFHQLMTGVNVTVSISQLRRDRAPVISAAVGRADENTLQFTHGFISSDHYSQLAEGAKRESPRERRRRRTQASARQPSTDVGTIQLREKRASSEPRGRQISTRKNDRDVPPAPIARAKPQKKSNAASNSAKASSSRTKEPKVVKMRFRSTAD